MIAVVIRPHQGRVGELSDEELERGVLEHVEMDRRAFVKRVVVGTAFAVPLVASFNMDALAQTTTTPETKPGAAVYPDAPVVDGPSFQNQTATDVCVPTAVNQAGQSNCDVVPRNLKPKNGPKPNRLVGPGGALLTGLRGVSIGFTKPGKPAGSATVTGIAVVKGAHSAVPGLNSKKLRTLEIFVSRTDGTKVRNHHFVMKGAYVSSWTKLGTPRPGAAGVAAKVSFESITVDTT
jgi:hypothetical protein